MTGTPQHSPAASSRKPDPRGVVLFTVLLLAGLAALWYLRELAVLLYASALFAVLMHPFVAAVQRRRLGRWRPGHGAAIAVVLVSVVALTALLGRLLAPPLWSEGNSLAQSWPRIVNHWSQAAQQNAVLRNLDVQQLTPTVREAGGLLLRFADNVAGFLASVFTVLLLTVYLLAEGRDSLEWALGFMAEPGRRRLAQALDRSQKRMRGWLFGQASLAIILTLASGTVFAALRLPYFYLLAIVSGLLSFVPILGPIMAAALMSVVASTQSWTDLAVVLIFFGTYQVVDNAYLTPRILRNSINVSGLAIILALAVGGAMAGVLGALLAVPSAALAAELVEEYGKR